VELSLQRRKLLRRLRSRKSREREGLFLVEGIRSAGEALQAGADVRFAVLSSRALGLPGGEEAVERLRGAGVDLHEVDDSDLAELSDTEAPQGLLLVCREPSTSLETLEATLRATGRERSALRILVLDGLQDPGNVGTLVRVAAAFGLSGVIALEGTVDPYNPKVVRASAGGVFTTPIVTESWGRVRPWLGSQGVRLLVADASGTEVTRVDPGGPWALVIGSEGAGARPEIRREAELSVGLRMPGGAESLNAAVAGSILLYVLTREGNVG